MGRALYREYRPHTLEDVAGQPHITKTLEKALNTGKISHAYLFTGPRGVGKTSVARILARQINGLEYNGEENYLDIIEIDAASNRGIEDVRELRDKVAVTPSSSKYKVYIIDEVHMLTTHAFNALLKTLEEPPAHVVFILATTEAHKVPDTIISRTQHFAFRPISVDSITEHLKNIAKSENISINDDALRLIATHGNGSFRDSIGLLDQLQQGKDTITSDDIRSLFGIAPESAIIELIDNISLHKPSEVHNIYESLLDQGITANSIAAQLVAYLRNDLQSGKFKLPPHQSLILISKLIEVAPSVNPEITLEVIILGEAFTNSEVENVKHPAKVPSNPIKVNNAQDFKAELPKTPEVESKISIKQKHIVSEPIDIKEEKDDKLEESQKNPDNFWPETLLIIKSSHYTLYGVLRLASFELNDKNITLGFKFKLHKKKASDPKNIDIITNAIRQCTGKIYSINCIIDEKFNDTIQPVSTQNVKDVKTPQIQSNEPLSTISNIFGGGELLES